MLSRDRSRQHRLVCTDCGQPMDAHILSGQNRSRWRDRAALALLFAISICVVGLVFSTEEEPTGESVPAFSQTESGHADNSEHATP